MLISKEIIGKRIAYLRKAAHMTQSELSGKIDISEKYLSRIECGKQLPSIVIVARICEILNVTADELLVQTGAYSNSKIIQNEMGGLSTYDQLRIIEIIKIVKEIKNRS